MRKPDSKVPELIFDLIEQAETSVDAKFSDARYFEAINELNKFDLENNANPEKEYLLGYCWYNISDEYTGRESQAVSHLRKSLELNPSHDLSKLYLGHIYFDKEQYEESLKYLDSVDLDKFVENSQIWRKLKVLELVILCKLYIGTDSLVLEEVERFNNAFLEADEEDRPVLHETILFLNSRSLDYATTNKSIIDRLNNMVLMWTKGRDKGVGDN